MLVLPFLPFTEINILICAQAYIMHKLSILLPEVGLENEDEFLAVKKIL